MRHKRLSFNQIDTISSKEEIREWFIRYFKIPPYKRFMRFTEIAKVIHYNRIYLRKMIYESGRVKITPEFQVRFTAFVREYGQPREVEKAPPAIKREIPEEVYKRFAEAIAALPTDMAAFYGINKYVYLTVRNGGVPQFRRPTFERLYEKLTGEKFEW